MMANRISKALEIRKAHKDPFRSENGYSWDYVMVFKVYKKSQKLSKKQQDPSASLKGIVDALAEAGLQTKLFYSVQVSIFIQQFISYLIFVICTRLTQ